MHFPISLDGFIEAGLPRKSTLSLGQLLGALSHALDITEGQPEGHCVRCCWIGLKVGQKLGLGEARTRALYYTLLLKDLGCSSNAARICQLYLTDDLSFKKGFKTVNGSIGQALNFVLRHAGSDARLKDRVSTIFSVLKNSDEIITEVFETRCNQGAEIAAIMRFPPDVCAALASLDEHWNGKGRPNRRNGQEIPIYARIALMAQVVDVFNIEEGSEAALREVRARSGSWFDPEVVRAFEDCAKDPDFWEVLNSDSLEAEIYAHPAANATMDVDPTYLDEIALGFARVIDAKSPFTHGHSERVAFYTDMICAELRYADPHRQWMRRAALLHDIGQLGVANTILDKPGKLTDDEFAQMKQHPVLGFDILSRVSAFHTMAHIAAAHHEKLNGRGYPYGLGASELTQDMRILAVADVFDALTAERPYREALTLKKTYEIMDKMAVEEIDPQIYTHLKAAV